MKRLSVSVLVFAIILLLSAVVSTGNATVEPNISINGISDTLNIHTGQPVKITIGLSPGEHNGNEADWWLVRNSSGKWYYYNLDGTWTDVGTAPSLDAFKPAYQGRLFPFGLFNLINIPKLSAGNYAYYFGIDLKKNGILDADSLYYSGVNVSISETWYKDTDGDGYSDGTSVLSVTRPYSNYYKESELLATSGDIDDNNPKVFPVGGITEITRIKISIQTSGAGWIAEANPISALSKDERKRRLGALLPSSIPRSAKRKFATRDKLPSYFDWRNNNGNFVTPVKDQGNCGSCWAFSAVAALESQVMINTGKAEDLSEQIVLSCSGAGSCEGGYPTSTSDFFKNVGVGLESCYPYTANDGNCKNACSNWRETAFKVDNWTYVDNTEDNIKRAIYANGPVVATMAVYADFFSYRSGVYRYAWGKFEDYHAIAIVGWDDAEGCFIVKNSWGTGWGGSGYFRIGYSEVTNDTEFGSLTIAYTTGKSTCIYNLSSTSNSFASSGGTGSVSVTATSDCTWTASSNASWITVTYSSSGNGNGTVTYSVASNSGTSSRTGTLTIAGQTFTVTQSGITCAYSINPTSNSVSSFGGNGSVSVTATSGCTWTASSNASWITVTSGASGNGNGTVSYSVASNSGTSSRTGMITIEGHTFTVNQSGISNVVVFPDKSLEAVIREAIKKPSGDILISDLQGLISLDAFNKGIVNLEGLQYCSNLTRLNLYVNQISNINVLAGLTNLTSLYLAGNQISDIGALAGMTKLTFLYLSGNQISNISSLAGLTKLTSLLIASNQISDINALAGLTNLTQLDIDGNKLNNINALSGLINLKEIYLSNNQISDIKPLVDNIGINNGDIVSFNNWTGSNPLSTISCTVYIPQLQSRGVTVNHNCP